MPLVMEKNRIPSRWAGRAAARLRDSRKPPAECINIALINNMPDSALEGTEVQFFELLEAAAENIPVRVQLYSLPKIPRGDWARQHLSSFYLDIDDLWNSRFFFDGLIMTGTEPQRPNLMDEPYWDALSEVLDWAENNTMSTVLSCLAAHAGVLYSDGIERYALSHKRFGVFDHTRVCDHPLTSGTAAQMRIPHSRWNDVRKDALTSCGYAVLTKSAEAGVDLFVKQRGRSLFVYFQGHPEYGALTLLREYRRDIGRFLRREREAYPSMPQGYFDAAGTKTLSDFREKALSDPREELLAIFPEANVVATLSNTWRSSATQIYRNWLLYLVEEKAGSSAYAGMSPVAAQ